MKNYIKILAMILSLFMVISVLPTQVISAQGMSDIDDISASQARNLVISGIDKFKQKSTVGYVLEGDGYLGIYAYDSINNIGVEGQAYTDEVGGDSDVDLGYKFNTWYDFKNKIKYLQTEYDADYNYASDKEFIYKYPMTKEEIQTTLDMNFKEFIDLKKDGFTKADSYTYEGLEWKTANGASHLCYKISVPDEDPSLYDYKQYYLPKDIYIGVDDGEIYGVHEEYILGTDREITIKKYDTNYFYPDRLSIPGKFKKAVLYPYYRLEKNNITYDYTLSVFGNNKWIFAAEYVTILEDEEDDAPYVKSITIPDTLKVAGKKYPVEEISSEAFFGETLLTRAKLGKNILYIGDNAFKKCIKLKSIIIPDKVKYLGAKAFSGCKKLKSVTLGKKLDTLQRKTFSGCSSLKTIKVKNKKLKSKLSSYTERNKAGIPAKVKII